MLKIKFLIPVVSVNKNEQLMTYMCCRIFKSYIFHTIFKNIIVKKNNIYPSYFIIGEFDFNLYILKYTQITSYDGLDSKSYAIGIVSTTFANLNSKLHCLLELKCQPW